MRILNVSARVYVEPDAFDSTIEFYEGLFGGTCRLRFSYPEARLEIASVGHILLIAGSEEDLKPFRATQSTFLVDNLDEFRSYLEKNEARILSGPNKVPTGRNMHVRHADGLMVEYVEHPSSDEHAPSLIAKKKSIPE